MAKKSKQSPETFTEELYEHQRDGIDRAYSHPESSSFCKLLLTLAFNKLEWFQLEGSHVEHSCSPLNNGLGASAEAPIFMPESNRWKYGLSLKKAIAAECFFQNPGIVNVWIW